MKSDAGPKIRIFLSGLPLLHANRDAGQRLSVMRKAEALFPADAGIKMTLEERYEKAGIPHRAAENIGKC
ncbi:MAG: hypothetical protein ACM3MB_07005 [Acidobacteriota bacterium]